MGVDWYACSHCGETYPDCGRCGTCANCEQTYCGGCYDEFVEKYGLLDESDERSRWYGEALPECDHCNGTIVSDSELLAFVLRNLGIDREVFLEEYRVIKKEDDALSQQ